MFAAVRPRKIKSTVHEALQGNAWVSHLAGSFTAQFLLEFSHLCDLLEDVQLRTRHFLLEVLQGSVVLRGFGLRRHVPWLFAGARSQIAMEDGGPSPCPLLLLAMLAWEVLDGGSEISTRPAALKSLHHVQPGAGDHGSHSHRVQLQQGGLAHLAP